MTTPATGFRVAARARRDSPDGKPNVPVPVDVYDDQDQLIETRTIDFRYPGDGAAMLLVAATGEDMDETEIISSLFKFLSRCISQEDNRFLRAQLGAGEIEAEDLSNMIGHVMEQWNGFPTRLNADSPQSPPSPGGSSTGRVVGPGSTLQQSPPIASSPTFDPGLSSESPTTVIPSRQSSAYPGSSPD